MSRTVQLRTAAWYGDDRLALTFPDDWQVTAWRPVLPAPLIDQQISAALERPVGQPPIRRLAQGKRRPLIIVDDLTRPTPAGRVLPLVLRQLGDAGIPADQVRIMLGTGTHTPPSPEAVAKKIGQHAASSCRVLLHDDTRNLASVGRTSFGSPIIVNREVLASDLLLGIGGVYPQHSVGFGGGSKLALGVLGKRSIISLHYGHPSMDGSYRVANDFRRDLDEMAARIGLRTTITMHVDADRQVVRMVSGDHFRYYHEAAAFSFEAYRAPLPGDADLVVSNSYPIDVSLTFMRSKGMTPLMHARPGASRILVCACSEGVGHHGLFPFVNGPRFGRQLHMARIARVAPSAIPTRAADFLVRRVRSAIRGAHSAARAGLRPEEDGQARAGPTWLYVPGRRALDLPPRIPGMVASGSWPDILHRVRLEQRTRKSLKVVVYACAPLQVLAASGSPTKRSAAAGVLLERPVDTALRATLGGERRGASDTIGQ